MPKPAGLPIKMKQNWHQISKIKVKSRAPWTTLIWLSLLLLAVAGCTRQEQQISGQVFAESGEALGEVAVTACYSGWGRSNGQLVWDKDYCSEPVLTDRGGRYLIYFRGPEPMRLRAEKAGWVQTRDFDSTQSRLILTPLAAYQVRSAAAAREREGTFLDRLPGETAANYYCRVIVSRVRSINLSYHAAKLAVTPSLLTGDASNRAYFALSGPAAATRSFCAEARIRANGQPVRAQFSLLPSGTSCKAELQLIEVDVPAGIPTTAVPLELVVPSLSAMFELPIWHQSP